MHLSLARSCHSSNAAFSWYTFSLLNALRQNRQKYVQAETLCSTSAWRGSSEPYALLCCKRSESASKPYIFCQVRASYADPCYKKRSPVFYLPGFSFKVISFSRLCCKCFAALTVDSIRDKIFYLIP